MFCFSRMFSALVKCLHVTCKVFGDSEESAFEMRNVAELAGVYVTAMGMFVHH